MVSYPSMNLVDLIIDEVALEGLDGITIEALWSRLAQRLHNPLPFSKPFMVQIWSICVQIREFGFHELETPREPLVIYDRYEFVDPDLGVILEPDDVPPDIYPHYPIYDTTKGIKGSCSTYYTRQEITETARNLSLDEVTEKYGQKLVIVASQSARNHALTRNEVLPTLELNAIQYCFLERVGRSRYHGEVTQGKLSLNALKEDPKSLFYHRKLLLRHRLITKQVHHQKSGCHSCTGSLLHLPRFFVERKPKVIFLAEEIIKILKSKPNYIAEYDEIKRKLQLENAIRKLFKTSFFQKVVKTDIMVPYRTLYPNAKPIEWQRKYTPAKEKKIKVVQLLHPTIDVMEAWTKDDIQEEDESHELNISSHKYNVPYLKQANRIIEESGSEGLCQGSLGKNMGLTKLHSRTILRNLVKRDIVATYMNDIGRQRLTKYVSKKFEKGSKLSKQLKKEMYKIKELTKHIVTESDKPEKSITAIEEKENTVISNQKRNVEEVTKIDTTSKDNENNDANVKEKPSSSMTDIEKTFYVVNRILYKYRLTKRRNKYKRTFSNIQSSKINKALVKDESINSSNVLSELSRKEKSAVAYKNIKVEYKVLTPVNTLKSDNKIFGLMEDVQNSEKNNMSNITYRLLRRANMIIESVKEHQVIDDMTKLMKMICEEEDKEGYDVKIDRKSLIRLLGKLDNVVKSIRITLSLNGKEKRMTFICNPNLDISSPVIQSAVEQAKLKFYFVLSSQRTKSFAKRCSGKSESSKNSNTDDTANKSEDKSSSGFKMLSKVSKCGPRGSKKYGYSPKFIRMKALHILLFYLIYEHPGEQTLSKKEQIKALLDNGFNVPNELISEFSTIYSSEISWKMFIPPLPKNSSWPQGWALMCDILLRLPLSIFLKIHFLSFGIPDLDKYANHPIRKHYLVRDLPLDTRNALLHARKYIFNVHETVTRLCYIGLVQFGPQRLKEKDQVFIYVNRRTEIMDTTSSAPSYHMIEDKPYPVIKYNFDGMHVVEKYWYDLWNTCINTSLGGRLVVQGKDIVLEDVTKKSDMIRAVVARTPEEAVRLDTGHVPGDRKGAAGIDSAFFAHLKRNWNWGISSSTHQTKSQQTVQHERDVYLSKIKAKPIKFTEFPGLKRVSGPPSVTAADLRKKVQVKPDEGLNQLKKYEALPHYRNLKQKSIVRRVLPRKTSYRRRTKYDEIDHRALQRMHKLRVDWDPCEDKILLVCKIAMVYLCPSLRKQVITFSMVRDVLRMYSLVSYNKTSRACQRRLLYMLRQQQNDNAIALGVAEMKQNFYIRKRFDGIIERLKEEYKNTYEFEKQVTETFKSLVAYIGKKYYDISDVEAKEPLPVPKSVQEFNIFYKVVHPPKQFGNHGFTKDVRNVNDIHSAVINSVIHSSMCCGKDRRSWAYQLFKVYQQYPETLLRNAMTKIRADQMVTVKKSSLPTIRKYGNYMPMSSSQYQLSSNYIYKFHTTWPYELFTESYDVYLKLANWYSQKQLDNQNDASNTSNGVEILPVTGGLIVTIHDFVVQDQMDFDIEIPDQVIMLDPRLKEKDETYFRIAQRYQVVLASLDNLKFSKEPPVSELQKSEQEKCFNSDVDVCNNTNVLNVDEKLDKDCFSNLDIEKNLSSHEYDTEDKNFEDAKSCVDYDDVLTFDSDEESGRTVADDEDNVIRFQDGTKIVLNKNDLERSQSYDENSQEEGKTSLVDDNNLEEASQAQIQNATTAEDKLLKSVDVTQIQNNGDGSLNMKSSVLVQPCLELNMDAQQKLITTGSKRGRDVDNEVFYSGEPVQKKAKPDNAVVESNEHELEKAKPDNEMVELNEHELEKAKPDNEVVESNEHELEKAKPDNEVSNLDVSEQEKAKPDNAVVELNKHDLEKVKTDKEVINLNKKAKLDNEVFELGEPVQKKAKLDNEEFELDVRKQEKVKPDNEVVESNEHDQEKVKPDNEVCNLDEHGQEKTEIDNEIVDVEKNYKTVPSNHATSTESVDEIQKEDLRKNSAKKTESLDEIQKQELRKNSAKETEEEEETGTKEGADDTKISNKAILNKESESNLLSKKDNNQKFTRVSDILKNKSFEPNYLYQYCKVDDSTDEKKRFTRIALLRMREELSELTTADSHHAHDYFVVNMFKILYSLHESDSQNSSGNEIFRHFLLPSELIPLRLCVANNVIQEINKFAAFPKDSISYTDFKKSLLKDSSLDLNNMDAVYKFIRDKKELGASIQELMNEFESTMGEDLQYIVSLFIEHRLFLRAGVTTVRYIHHRHADAWLIDSYKICRLKKESLTPMPRGTVYVTEPEVIITEGNDLNFSKESNDASVISNNEEKNPSSPRIDDEEPIISDTQSEVKTHKIEDCDKDSSSHSDEECITLTKKRMQRKRTRLLPQRDISRAAKQLDLATKQEIRVVIKPWIRIDGALNRRVLDRMLGAILTYCMNHPGIALTKVQNRFVPALQPYHTRELVEMLEKLKCLKKIIIKKPRVTLFSKPSPVDPKITNTNWVVEEDIYLEPANGAMLKFGIFLSTKLYKSDYIT
ncbi:general transcription factor 3C polypeptide 1 isoform X1 [Hylaeus anthracinus]|uniref:general transcription factor 3C polypeptide 1 isoform X1 n=1 Tax=Hylaeus anthracinus TaxID=313031 RepID=UPI0023B93EA4|nr:general transcription factor 3C polypeptide 1 isoform X1 [Hylaeus anthracinus]